MEDRVRKAPAFFPRARFSALAGEFASDSVAERLPSRLRLWQTNGGKKGYQCSRKRPVAAPKRAVRRMPVLYQMAMKVGVLSVQWNA